MKNAITRNNGFTLIEILVGLAVGLLSTVVIMQIFAVSEGRKRTASGTADAQMSGGVALYTIERDLRMAGYGLPKLTSNSPLDCTSFYSYYNADGKGDDGQPLGDFSENGLTPLTIKNGVEGDESAPDTLSVRYSNNSLGAVTVSLRSTMPNSSSELNVTRTTGCRVNDLAILSQGANCTLMQVTHVQPEALKIQHNKSSPYNPPPGKLDSTWPAYTANNPPAALSCLGDWTVHTYSIQDRKSLVLVSSPSTTKTEINTGIVDLQAQYGVSSTPESSQVTEWVNPTGVWANPSASYRKRIKAVRLALVTRSDLMEKEVVTTPCTTIGGVENSGPCAWEDTAENPAPKIDLSDDPNWQRYRYRVFETIVPLRNLIWAKGNL